MSISETIEDLVREQISEQLSYQISQLINTVCSERMEDFADKRSGEIAESQELRKQIYNLIDRSMPTVLGNRLRCGIYEHSIFKEVFDNYFEEGMKDQIRAEIRGYVRDECKTEIHNYFNTVLGAVKQNERFIDEKLDSLKSPKVSN